MIQLKDGSAVQIGTLFTILKNIEHCLNAENKEDDEV
jgi:hypothetical protein